MSKKVQKGHYVRLPHVLTVYSKLGYVNNI